MRLPLLQLLIHKPLLFCYKVYANTNSFADAAKDTKQQQLSLTAKNLNLQSTNMFHFLRCTLLSA